MTDTATKRCSKCSQVKPLGEFYRSNAYRDGHRAQCKDCYNAQRRSAYPATRERIQAEHRDYRQRNRQKVRAASRQWYEQNRDYAIEVATERHAELRAQVLAHYGQECACCGITERLSIDHVNGDGREHREELFGTQDGATGTRFYAWLVREGFPGGFQVLCRSCNISKGHGERCRLKHP